MHIKEALPRYSDDSIPNQQQAKELVRRQLNKEYEPYKKQIKTSHSIKTPSKTTSPSPEPQKKSDDDDDDKTVNNDTVSVPENLKSTFQDANNILKKYDNSPDSLNIFNVDKADYIELNKLIDKVQNKKPGKSDVRTLIKIREKLHYNQRIEYTLPPTISPTKTPAISPTTTPKKKGKS